MKQSINPVRSARRVGLNRPSRILALCASIFVLFQLTTPAAVYVGSDRLWPNGVVPYEWADDMPLVNRARVAIAMNIWKEVANVDFVIHTDEKDYVLIQNALNGGPSRSPNIGRNGNKQDLFIRVNLTNITDHGLAHELGHVLGYYHTHQRPDRDRFVTWYPERTKASGTNNFLIVSNSLAYPRNAMDYDSVMSYGRCTFAICDDCKNDLNNCRVLEINDPFDALEFDEKMGKRDYLTRIDSLVMSFMYPPSGWKFVDKSDPTTQEKGTFHDPYLTLEAGVGLVPLNGTVWIQPGEYRMGTTVLNARLTLRAPVGGVIVRPN